ncbi:MAG TPA: PD-(D/E)XK nuclease family protein, partial [Gammaproteobacteria bacterium]|nr:PD-(D/E)XK nuclease family protein [Gammaproteobacteria bacterium]
KTLSLRLAQGATLIAEDRLAAVQLEAFALRSRGSTRESAWRSPRVSTQAAWADEMWLRFPADDRSLLSGSQTAALWRKIVAESAEGDELIDHARIADWAAAAWRLLWSWRIDYRTLRANAEDTAFAAFLRWARAFDDLTAGASWIDGARLPAVLASPAAAHGLRGSEVLWVDPIIRSPLLNHLVGSLAAAGCHAQFWAPGALTGSAWRAGIADRREEVRAASRWAQRRLGVDPSLRLAIVVAPEGGGEQGLEWDSDERFSADAHDEVTATNLDGERLERDPAIGAALTCVELAGQHADFAVLSRWLRSPFLGEGIEDRAARCSAEAELRSEPIAQLRFHVGYRRAGLRSWLGRRLPQATSVLDALIAQLDELPRMQSPTRWARFFSLLLTSCAWPGSECRVPRGSLDAWGEALDELTQLSPIRGTIDVETALAELRNIASRRRLHSPAPLHGVSVLSRAELVGYGYDAVWITGMSDRVWPRAAEPNPLLPLRLQVAHGLPLATPASALSWSRDVLTSLARRVPELICSYPLVEDEHSAAPSPLIRSFPELPELISPAGSWPYSCGGGALESIEDPAPPLAGVTVAGGAATLRWQARCPLRAFVESRLAAKPLEAVARGLNPRQRGIATHRALELLMGGIPGQAALAALAADDRKSRIQSSSRAALRERARGADRELRVFLDLEQERLEALLDAVLLAELRRADFRIEGLEIRHIAQLDGLQVSCRVDRLDRLSDGRVAVIDYKTGQRATPLDWLRPRLLEPQLPLYARVIEDDVGALVLVGLQTKGVSYRGLWDGDAAFPSRPQALPPGVGWTEQQQRWSRQLTELLAEYAAGDTRISAAGWEAAAGALAPLTRVYESLLLRGESPEADDT